MPKFCLRLYNIPTLIWLTLVTGCSSTLLSGNTRNTSSLPVSNSAKHSTCSNVDSLLKAVDKAQNAAIVAKSAQSKQQWDTVASQLIQAIQVMQAVPPDNPKRIFAQKKAAEYLKKLKIAQQKAMTSAQPPFSSFNNQIFDDQLLLYLSYVSAVGPPDVLIVGSSRALVGVDPSQLEQALATQGKGHLKIFNFGINGATAKLVDFQLRQLLTPQQLPRLILWADGVRAFNSGRVDRTYNSLVASQGYKHLMAGDRPTLPPGKSETTSCQAVSSNSMSNPTRQPAGVSIGLANLMATATRQLAQVTVERGNKPVQAQNAQLANTPVLSQQITSQNPTGYSSSAIDGNGFLPLDNRFNSKRYYQQNPRVPGRYDTDYLSLSLTGQQAAALNSAQAWTKQHKIPLVFVNLPLTQDYLDSSRRSIEQRFRRFMQQQASPGFIFIDLGSQWLTEEQYFIDPSHLNRYGAGAVSNLLATNRQIPWPQPRR